MTDVLDEADLEALISALSFGPAEEETTGRGLLFSSHRRDLEDVEIRDYDFKRPERLSRDRMRALRTLHETFARTFASSLSGLLRTIVEVRVVGADQLSYAEFVASLPSPTSFNLIDSPPLKGQVCLEISPPIVYPIIDRLLGGRGDEVFVRQRPMTLIETRLIGKIVGRATAALAEAWEPLRKIDFSPGPMGSDPRALHVVPPNEMVVVVGFEIRLGNRAGTMNLCFPFTVIEPVRENLAVGSSSRSGRHPGGPEWGRLIGRRLAEAPLELTSILAETSVTVAELRDLEVGDLILTEKPADAPVTLLVGDVPKYLAALGRHRGNRAVRILRPIHGTDGPQGSARRALPRPC